MTYATAQTAANLIARIDRRSRNARQLVTDARLYAKDPQPFKLWALHPARVEKAVQDLRGLTQLLAEVAALEEGK